MIEKSYYNTSIWSSDSTTSVSILVPTRDMVHSYFSFCLAEMIKLNTEQQIRTHLFFDTSTILLNQRNNLVKRAKETDSEYVLWLDSDMMFPSTTTLRLLSHEKDVVACNYMKRSKPLKTVAYTSVTDWDSWLPLTKTGTLEKVEGVGMGCMLMKTDIFSKLETPYFVFPYNEQTDDWHGEDFELCKKIKKLGIDILIDMDLSTEIKHMGMFSFGYNFPVNKVKENKFKIKNKQL